MKTFRVVVYLLGLIILLLLIWQMYGVHHYPNINVLPGVHRVVVMTWPPVVHSGGNVEGLRCGW